MERFAKRVIQALNESPIDYVIIGGFVAIIYGRPRTTMDIDVILNFKENNMAEIQGFVNVLQQYDLDAHQKDILLALKEKSHFSIFDKSSPWRIDGKGVYTKLDEITLSNRRQLKILGLSAWVESPEDLVIAKLIYGSQQDIEDAVAVLLNLKRQLNMDYLEKRAIEENIADILHKILSKI